MTPVIVTYVLMAGPALKQTAGIRGTTANVPMDFQGKIASITLQPMTLVIQILVETAPRALKTIITPEIIIARVQEDTRVKTVITMSVIMKQRHMIPVIPIHVIMAARAIITMDIRDTIARAEVDILAVIATAITGFRWRAL